MSGADTPEFQNLRRVAERQSLPALLDELRLTVADLPLLWDADFLFGPRSTDGQDTFVLCEANVSAVWPFPAEAAAALAAAALQLATHGRARRP